GFRLNRAGRLEAGIGLPDRDLRIGEQVVHRVHATLLALILALSFSRWIEFQSCPSGAAMVSTRTPRPACRALPAAMRSRAKARSLSSESSHLVRVFTVAGGSKPPMLSKE